MSKKTFVRWIILPVTLVVFAGLIGQNALAADPVSVAARHGYVRQS